MVLKFISSVQNKSIHIDSLKVMRIPSYTFQFAESILIPINANPMQVLCGAFLKTTISKNTHFHVSKPLNIFPQLQKYRYCKKEICGLPIQYKTTIQDCCCAGPFILLMFQITTWRTNHCLGIISSSL